MGYLKKPAEKQKRATAEKPNSATCWLGCLFNQSPAAAIGASCKESWSRVELGLGRHFILVTGVSVPQDQTSYSLASQRRHLSFKLSHFLRRLLLFYDNPSSSSTSPLGTSRFLSHSFSPLGWRLPATRATPGENGDGDVLRPSPVHQLEPHSSAVDVTDQPHSSGQQPCPASSADCQPVQLTSEDSSHPAQHVYSRRRLHLVSKGKTTPEDQQSSPVASLPVASSDSGSLSQFSPKHRAYLMSVQSSHEPESFAEAFNHSCWRDAMQEEINAQEKDLVSLPAGKQLKKAIYVTASDKLKQAPRAKKGAWFKKFSSFLTASFLIKGSTVAVRILPCLFVDVMVVASSFFYTLTTTFSPGMILLFYSISSRSLETNLSLSSAALLSRHGGISLHLWTSPNL
ncbi:hypothetical protein ACOSQ2_003160 [Xanthoceras sorbifolium]